MMARQQEYLSALWRPRAGRRERVLWLVIPWLLVLPWCVRIGSEVLPSAPANGLGKGVAATGLLLYLALVGVPAFLGTWVLLVVSWPEHRRVFCWLALAGWLGVWFLPTDAFGYLPLFVALSMIAAIVEQALAAWRARPDHAAPAV